MAYHACTVVIEGGGGGKLKHVCTYMYACMYSVKSSFFEEKMRDS